MDHRTEFLLNTHDQYVYDFFQEIHKLRLAMEIIGAELAQQNNKLADIEASIYHATSRPD